MNMDEKELSEALKEIANDEIIDNPWINDGRFRFINYLLSSETIVLKNMESGKHFWVEVTVFVKEIPDEQGT